MKPGLLVEASYVANLETDCLFRRCWSRPFHLGDGAELYLAGIGAEEESAPAGASAPIRHHGDPYEQCKYAYDKIKQALAAHGGTLADAVKQVVYVTDIRYQEAVGKCRSEAYAGMPIPANTFLVISGLAIQGMLLEIDVTAVVPK